jgi:hypothetical protein
MAYVPKDAEWYIAGIIMEFTIEGDPRNVVHVNSLLVHASSPEDAYEKAIDLGKSEENVYLNTDNKQVAVKFRGLSNLIVIHDQLEHGEELFFREQVGVPQSEITKIVREKSELAVFAPDEDRQDIPNYMPQRVMRMLESQARKQDNLPDTLPPYPEPPGL